MNKLCQTKPISKMPKMIVSAVMTMTTNKKLRTTNYLKQTQTNPIQSQNLLAVRGAKPNQTQTKPIYGEPVEPSNPKVELSYALLTTSNL
jgi:hypothetical protein